MLKNVLTYFLAAYVLLFIGYGKFCEHQVNERQSASFVKTSEIIHTRSGETLTSEHITIPGSSPVQELVKIATEENTIEESDDEAAGFKKTIVTPHFYASFPQAVFSLVHAVQPAYHFHTRGCPAPVSAIYILIRVFRI